MKLTLSKMVKERQAAAGAGGVDNNGKELKRVHSAETLAQQEPLLGLPAEPQEDIEEMVKEVKAEIEKRDGERKRRASGAQVKKRS